MGPDVRDDSRVKALVGAVVLCAWVTVGVVAARRDDQERRRLLRDLEGHTVVVEFRPGRGEFMRERRGILGPGRTRWSVVLGTGYTATDDIPLSALRCLTDEASGTKFGPWR